MHLAKSNRSAEDICPINTVQHLTALYSQNVLLGHNRKYLVAHKWAVWKSCSWMQVLLLLMKQNYSSGTLVRMLGRIILALWHKRSCLHLLAPPAGVKETSSLVYWLLSVAQLLRRYLRCTDGCTRAQRKLTREDLTLLNASYLYSLWAHFHRCIKVRDTVTSSVQL